MHLKMRKGEYQLIYDKIKEIALIKKIPISRIERDCELSKGSICKWNEIEPSALKLKKVADLLKVKVDKLLEQQRRIN